MEVIFFVVFLFSSKKGCISNLMLLILGVEPLLLLLIRLLLLFSKTLFFSLYFILFIYNYCESFIELTYAKLVLIL